MLNPLRVPIFLYTFDLAFQFTCISRKKLGFNRINL